MLWRGHKLQGSHDKGLIVLADVQRPRFEIRWDTVRKRKFDPAPSVRRHLLAGVARRQRPQVDATLAEVEHPHFAPMLHRVNEEVGFDRWVAYSPHSRRLFDIAYLRGAVAEDRQFHDAILPAIADLPLDEPQPWAVFDTSFVTPPGLRHIDSEINLGDMSVTVGTRKGNFIGRRITVRQVYPGSIALKRQPMRAWMFNRINKDRKVYRPQLPRRARRNREYEPWLSDLGTGVWVNLKLRAILRLYLWRAMGRRVVGWVLDEATDRLVMIDVAVPREELEGALAELVEGAHWARRMADGAASPEDAAADSALDAS